MTIEIDEAELRQQIIEGLVQQRTSDYLRRAFSLQVTEVDKAVQVLASETISDPAFIARLRPLLESALLEAIPERVRIAVRNLPTGKTIKALAEVLSQQQDLDL